jgi:prepilin-type N-terminal cleavage/methylation domain-containing protein
MITDREKMNEDGLTLIEVLVTTVIMSILVFTVGFAFIIGLKQWDEGYTRSQMRTKMVQALELVTKNLRQATVIDELTAGSITFTADLGSGSTSHRVYIYHPDDASPNPPYTEQGEYQLRWAVGTVTYGSGAIIATDIDRPSPTATRPFSLSGNVITMDFTLERGDVTFDMRSKVRVRNL